MIKVYQKYILESFLKSILTPSMYEVFSANAKFPTNKLIVKT